MFCNIITVPTKTLPFFKPYGPLTMKTHTRVTYRRPHYISDYFHLPLPLHSLCLRSMTPFQLGSSQGVFPRDWTGNEG